MFVKVPDFDVIEIARIYYPQKVDELEISKKNGYFDLYPGPIGEVMVDEEYEKMRVNRWYLNQLESYNKRTKIYDNRQWLSNYFKDKYNTITKDMTKTNEEKIIQIIIERKALLRF